MTFPAKLYRPLLLLLIITQSPSLLAQEKRFLEVAKTGVVKVTAEVGESQKSGTGFIVQLGSNFVHVVTASHLLSLKQEDPSMVDMNPKVKFHKSLGEAFPATTVWQQETGVSGYPDLAVLRVVASNLPPGLSALCLARFPTDLDLGGDVDIIGFPVTDLGVSIAKGTITTKPGLYLKFSASSLSSGYSGSPLIKEDQVVGMVTQTGPQANRATPAVLIQVFMEGLSDSGVAAEICELPLPPECLQNTTLRSQAAQLLEKSVREMIKRKGFRDSSWNPDGDFSNDYHPRGSKDEEVIVDCATGLTWQKSGSSGEVTLNEAKEYVRTLNEEQYAGYSDWRLPTLEELASLLEPGKRSGWYIDPVFDTTQATCWSTDQEVNSSDVWVIDFFDGIVASLNPRGNISVRAVR